MDKPIDWRGSSLDELREFPETERKQAGYELRKLQRGEIPMTGDRFPKLGQERTRSASTAPMAGSV
jgi:phage-related protein